MTSKKEDTVEAISKIREAILIQFDALSPLVNLLEAEIDVKTSISLLQEQVGGLEKTIQQSQHDLNKRITSIEDSLRKQTDQLFLSDEEHKQMVKHVHTVLGQLEEYLRRHTWVKAAFKFQLTAQAKGILNVEMEKKERLDLTSMTI